MENLNNDNSLNGMGNLDISNNANINSNNIDKFKNESNNQ